MPRGRSTSKHRPPQGALLRRLRLAAGLSQTELARRIGVPQPNITFWELSEKPPRSDVLPAMADALGVTVEDLLHSTSRRRASKSDAAPIPKLRRMYEDAARLPRRQQEKIADFVHAYVKQYESERTERRQRP